MEKKYPLVSEVELTEDNPLAQMYRLFNPDIPAGRKLSYAVFAEYDREYDMIAKFCFNRMTLVASRYNSQYRNAIAMGIPIDAMVRVVTVGQANDAWAFIVPPVNGGRHVEATDILIALYQIKVINGINFEDIQRASQNRIYMKALHVAAGQPSVPGRNGSVTDRFPRVPKKYNFDEDEEGDVDFKNTGWLLSVRKGDVICDIVPAREGRQGINVFGERLPAKTGKPPVIPQGKNTSVTPDGSMLVADTDGHLIFEDGCFRVERNLVINGNVGNATGNIDTHGNVRIMGDVPTGYSVRTSGNLTINGTVQGAEIYAGGNLIIEKGVAGEYTASIEAGGFIRCGYIQDCKMKAGKDIIAESIVTSEIRTEGSVNVTSGQGTIVGGRTSSRYGIKALVFGNDNSKYTELDLSLPPGNAARYKILSASLADLEKKRSAALKHREIIWKKAQLASRNGEPPEKVQAILASENDGKNPSPEDLSDQIDNINEQIYELEQIIKLYEASEIRAAEVNPNTMIIINGAKRQVKNYLQRCIFKKGYEKVKLEKYDEEARIIETEEDDDQIIEIEEKISAADQPYTGQAAADLTEADAEPEDQDEIYGQADLSEDIYGIPEWSEEHEGSEEAEEAEEPAYIPPGAGEAYAAMPDSMPEDGLPVEDDLFPYPDPYLSAAEDLSGMFADSSQEIDEMEYFSSMFASEPSSIF